MFNLKNRVAELERKMARLEQKENCKRGIHIWVMVQEGYSSPFVRCSACYALAGETK